MDLATLAHSLPALHDFLAMLGVCLIPRPLGHGLNRGSVMRLQQSFDPGLLDHGRQCQIENQSCLGYTL